MLKRNFEFFISATTVLFSTSLIQFLIFIFITYCFPNYKNNQKLLSKTIKFIVYIFSYKIYFIRQVLCSILRKKSQFFTQSKKDLGKKEFRKIIILNCDCVDLIESNMFYKLN